VMGGRSPRFKDESAAGLRVMEAVAGPSRGPLARGRVPPDRIASSDEEPRIAKGLTIVHAGALQNLLHRYHKLRWPERLLQELPSRNEIERLIGAPGHQQNPGFRLQRRDQLRQLNTVGIALPRLMSDNNRRMATCSCRAHRPVIIHHQCVRFSKQMVVCMTTSRPRRLRKYS